jgi:hypothetical protein
MRCAQRPTLSSTSWVLIAVVFAVGVLLLGISSAMLRSVREETRRAPQLSWPQLIDESLKMADVQLRLDMIERLRIVDSEWSRGVLERAREEDPDESVRSAIELALEHSNV